MKEVIIYTDGACSGNPGPGGWCAILIYKGREKQISGYEKDTTNNRMELMAAKEALLMLKEKCSVKLYSDSSYLINAFNQGWIYNWKKKNWHKQDKTPVKNVDLWMSLSELNNRHNIEWIKVQGHSDDEYNNRCDKEAVLQIKSKEKNTDDI